MAQHLAGISKALYFWRTEPELYIPRNAAVLKVIPSWFLRHSKVCQGRFNIQF